MAPVQPPARTDKDDRKVEDIQEFAHKLVRLLQDRNPIPTDLHTDLEREIKRVHGLTSTSAVAQRASAFDAAGTELWNATTNLLRDAEAHAQGPQLRRDAPSRIKVLLRVYAFHLLDVAYHASSKRTKDVQQRIRNFKLALKACQTCLENSELQMSMNILERCSDHVSTVEDASPLLRLSGDDDDGDGITRMKTLTTEFYLLRIMHAWKTGRLDVAKHFTSKLDAQSARAAHLAEKAADLYYEIAKHLLKQSDIQGGTDWLDRALASLDVCDVEHLSDDAADLRLSISAKLVRCLSSTSTLNDFDRAKQLVQHLTEDPSIGNRLAVQVMHLDMLLAEAPVPLQHVHAVLSRMVRATVLTDQSFKIIIHAVHRTKKHSVQCACEVLRALIVERLLPILVDGTNVGERDRTRLDRSCVTVVLFTIKAPDDEVGILMSSLQKLLDELVTNDGSLLSAQAVHAIQTLLWPSSGSSHSETVDSRLELLRHPAFDGAGMLNKARIGRKAIVTALQRNDIDAARESYFRMPSAARNEKQTQYLMFKVALRCDDYETACTSLESITKHTRDDGKFLYACVLEAQESNMRHIAVAAFRALLDRQPPGVHLPTLLRCSVRLLAAELETSTPDQVNDLVDEIARIFENAAANLKTLRQVSGEHWRAEIQWWSKNAYNLSLKLCGSVHPEHLCRLLATCTIFIDGYPNDSGVMHEDGLKRRQMLCHFLAASAFVVLARSGGDGDEYSLQCYVHCRQQVGAFKALLDASLADEDTSRRMFELLKYEVEGILRLQQWDQLNNVLQACLDHKDVDRWDSLADLVLIIHSQSSLVGFETRDNAQVKALLQRIINDTWKKDKDLAKVSRWLRLSFSIDLSEGDGSFALKLVQQSADMARKGYGDSADSTYPETELQWLAASAFNKAIDFLSAGDYELATIWMEAALEVARYAADQGALHGNLSYKQGLAMQRIGAANSA